MRNVVYLLFYSITNKSKTLNSKLTLLKHQSSRLVDFLEKYNYGAPYTGDHRVVERVKISREVSVSSVDCLVAKPWFEFDHR